LIAPRLQLKKRLASVIAAAPIVEMLIRFQPTLKSVDYFPAVALDQRIAAGCACSYAHNSVSFRALRAGSALVCLVAT
jgi:hypothetical protein